MSDQHDVNERAERAILSSAEAYRLVEEAHQMRSERDAARAALRKLALRRANDNWIWCDLCLATRRLTDEEIDTHTRIGPEPHRPSCMLADDRVLSGTTEGTD